MHHRQSKGVVNIIVAGVAGLGTLHVPYTGGIEKILAKENFRKILKVGHFYSGFSYNKNYNKIKHSNRVALEFARFWSQSSNETH